MEQQAHPHDDTPLLSLPPASAHQQHALQLFGVDICPLGMGEGEEAKGVASPHLEDTATIFSQEATHHEEVVEGDERLSAGDLDMKRAEITRTFFQTFFEYPTVNGLGFQVAVDLVDFLYEGIVPVRYRQRKQERAKYRLNELRDAFHKSTTTPADPLLGLPPHLAQLHHHHQQQEHQSGAADAFPASFPPPPQTASGVDTATNLSPGTAEAPQRQQQMLLQVHSLHLPAALHGAHLHAASLHGSPSALHSSSGSSGGGGGSSVGVKRKQVFDKKAWTKRQSNRTYWLGMRGPLFPANPHMLRKLESLLGHPFPQLTDHAFHLAWEHEQARRAHSLAPSPALPSPSPSSGGAPPPAKHPRLSVEGSSPITPSAPQNGPPQPPPPSCDPAATTVPLPHKSRLTHTHTHTHTHSHTHTHVTRPSPSRRRHPSPHFPPTMCGGTQTHARFRPPPINKVAVKGGGGVID
jgi:hypothetical protein